MTVGDFTLKQTRRQFLSTCAISATSLAFSTDVQAQAEQKKRTIARIELFPVRFPTVMRFKFLESPKGATGRASVMIKVTADDGTVGWGESIPSQRWSYETLESAVSTLDHYLIPVLIGMDPFDLDAIHAAMNREIGPGFSTGAPITKAGIDFALHDLIGKALGRNLAELWDRTTPDTLTLSWTLNPVTLDDLEPLIEKGQAQGFRHFNVKVGPDPEFDIEMCRIVKRLVPDGFLWGDANGGYDLETALTVAPKYADLGMDVFEQPLPANQLTGYQALKRQGALPIILDEGVVSPEDLTEFIALGCCDGVAMKPCRCGGLVSARRQIEILRDKGLLFLGSGLTEPDISLAASLILYGAYDLNYPAALNGPQFLGASVITEPFKPVDGTVKIPKGPGLGIQVDESAVTALVEQSK
ncbi:MAG: mandelate racemase [Candidatus Hydrogenedentes bacterium]|nr:mandelate racemase [Candidatus Hydrogenedentota bacterium]